MNLFGMKRREQALLHMDQLAAVFPEQLTEDVFSQVVTLTQFQTDQNKAVDHLTLLTDILTEAYIDASTNDFKNTKTIKILETRLANYPSLDYE